MVLFNRLSHTGTPYGTPWGVLIVLILAVLAPTVFLLWFMNAAVKNERLAVRQRLADVYRKHALETQASLAATEAARLSSIAKATAESPTPSSAFASLVNANLADSFVIFDAEGKLAYPAENAGPAELEMPPAWFQSSALEYEDARPAGAAEAFGRIAADSLDADLAARALQAKARCLVEAGLARDAVAVLTGPLADSRFAGVADSHGALVQPNALLLAFELSAEAEPSARAPTAKQLAARVNDYSGPAMSSSQRRFLMHALSDAEPKAALPTLAAEDLAAQYVAFPARPPMRPGVYEQAAPGLWQLTSSDGRVVALFREATLLAQAAARAGLSRTADGAEIGLVPPSAAATAAEPFLALPAGASLPGWRIEVHLVGADPFTAAAGRQTAVYIWTALIGICVFASAALLAARYITRQIRLTRLKNDLIATVTHELKTPLASMRVLVDTLLAGRVASAADAREYFQLIAKENERLSRLVDNFLTFSRMERGKRALERERIAVADVVTAAVQSVKERFEGPNCMLTVDLPEDLPSVIGDRDGLVTVLVNLLDNAYKYTGDTKRVALRAYDHAGSVCLAVSDNGIGFSQRDRKRIFERFYQADQRLSRSVGGCGLGLSIVKFIVEAHGGSVEAASEPGNGSTFTVRLPAADSGAAG